MRARTDHARLLLLTISALVAFVAALYGRFLFPLDATGGVDTDFFFSWQLVVNDALRHWKLLHWNSHLCGGTPGLANPQSGVLSPFNLLALLGINPALQMKIELVLHLALCAWGFALLCRRLRAPMPVGLVGFFIASGNGFLVFRVLNGQITFYPLFLIPLLIALAWPPSVTDTGSRLPAGQPKWRRDWPRRRDVLLGILVLCLMILEDGVYAYVYTFVLLGVWSLVISVARRSVSHLILIAVWALVPVALCMFRILPMAELLASPGLLGDLAEKRLTLHMPMGLVLKALFHFQQAELYPQYRPDISFPIWSSCGAFLGPVPLLLAAFALRLRKPDAATWGLVAAGIVGLALMFGHFSPWAPWALLRRLPLVGALGAPWRFAIVMILSSSVLAVAGLNRLVDHVTLRGWRLASRSILVLVVLLAVGGPLIYSLHPLFPRDIWVRRHLPAFIDRSRPFQQGVFNWKRMYEVIPDNIGVVNCYGSLGPPSGVQEHRPAAFLEPRAGTARLRVEPNELIVDVDAAAATTLVIQQNYHRDWAIEEGKTRSGLGESNGLLAVQVPAGKQQLRLGYRPTSFHRGLFLSGLALLGLALAASFLYRGKRSGSSRDRVN
jgi:hypothetical protein